MDDKPWCLCPNDECVMTMGGRTVFVCNAAPWFVFPNDVKCKARHAYQPALDEFNKKRSTETS